MDLKSLVREGHCSCWSILSPRPMTKLGKGLKSPDSQSSSLTYRQSASDVVYSVREKGTVVIKRHKDSRERKSGHNVAAMVWSFFWTESKEVKSLLLGRLKKKKKDYIFQPRYYGAGWERQELGIILWKKYQITVTSPWWKSSCTNVYTGIFNSSTAILQEKFLYFKVSKSDVNINYKCNYKMKNHMLSNNQINLIYF